MANVSDLAEGHSTDNAAPRRAGLARNMTEVDYYQLETIQGGCAGEEGRSQDNTPTGGADEGLLVSGSRGEGRRSPAALRVHFEKCSSPGGDEEEEEEVQAPVSETVL